MGKHRNVVARGDGDLYHKYRPHRFEEIVGHDSVVDSVRSAIAANQSQAFLLTGDSGTGKTTTARIMALAVNCEAPQENEPCLECKTCKFILSGNSPDILEMNAADARGIDAIREMCANMAFAPMAGKKRVYILDEAHQLTNDAQNTLLKYLEEAPSHVLIVLCSTHPKKIIPTVRNRCQKFNFNALGRADMLLLVEEVVRLEAVEVPQEAVSAVVDASGGSPRNALVALQQVVQLESVTPEAVSALLGGESEDANAIKLCFAVNAKQPKWHSIVKVYDEVKHLGAPALGMTLAGYFRNQLLKAPNPAEAVKRAQCLDLFLTPFDSGKPGENQLVSALFKAFQARIG